MCPLMITATVTSMDTVTEGYARWSLSMDGHSYCDIHGHWDRGVGTVVSIHKWPWMILGPPSYFYSLMSVESTGYRSPHCAPILSQQYAKSCWSSLYSAELKQAVSCACSNPFLDTSPELSKYIQFQNHPLTVLETSVAPTQPFVSQPLAPSDVPSSTFHLPFFFSSFTLRAVISLSTCKISFFCSAVA